MCRVTCLLCAGRAPAAWPLCHLPLAMLAPCSLPAGSTRKAAELVDQLHASGLVGSQQLYHGLLTSCQAAGDWELGLEVFLGMQVGGWVLS